MRLVVLAVLVSCARERPQVSAPAPIAQPVQSCIADYRAARDVPAQPHELKVLRVEHLVAGFLARRATLPDREAKLCHDQIAALTSKLARIHHNHGAFGEPSRLVYAERLYAAYLVAFPTARDAAENRFFFAELLWRLAERAPTAASWERAARAYGDALAGPLDPKIRKETSYAAVLSWEKVVAITAAADPKLDAVPREFPIPESERQLLAAFTVYVGQIKDPQDDEIATMAFLAGKIFLRYDHLDEAIERFTFIIANHPNHEVAPFAEALLLAAQRRHATW
jgi:hypothetical protein